MKIKQFLIAVCVGTMFAACSSKNEPSHYETAKEIHIKTQINKLQTRADENPTNLQNTQFVENAKINVYFTNETTGAKLPGLGSADYATYTNTASGWTTDVSGLTYPMSNDGVEIFAIYPSQDSGGNFITKSTSKFSVQTNQDTDEKYRQSDLMYAYDPCTQSQNDPQTLRFNHCLAKIIVKINPEPAMTKEDFLNCLSDMYIENVKNTANLSIENGVLKATVDPTSNNSMIFIGSGSEDFCEEGMSAIIVPQTVASGKTLFYIDFGAKESWLYRYCPWIAHTKTVSQISSCNGTLFKIIV